ncbi:MAG: hypothetical protein HOG73_02305 [Candidatus Marinimicrobia bacterium]|nr:hypothetical protein [Candidatus Neomarinimicrobiota bacterium]
MTDELNKKITSPKTIQIQNSKTAQSRAQWFWISTSDTEGIGQGTYNVGAREMKRERLADKKLRAKQAKAAQMS